MCLRAPSGNLGRRCLASCTPREGLTRHGYYLSPIHELHYTWDPTNIYSIGPFMNVEARRVLAHALLPVPHTYSCWYHISRMRSLSSHLFRNKTRHAELFTHRTNRKTFLLIYPFDPLRLAPRFGLDCIVYMSLTPRTPHHAHPSGRPAKECLCFTCFVHVFT